MQVAGGRIKEFQFFQNVERTQDRKRLLQRNSNHREHRGWRRRNLPGNPVTRTDVRIAGVVDCDGAADLNRKSVDSSLLNL